MTVAATTFATLGTAALIHQGEQSLQELRASLKSTYQMLQCCKFIIIRLERPPEETIGRTLE